MKIYPVSVVRAIIGELRQAKFYLEARVDSEYRFCPLAIMAVNEEGYLIHHGPVNERLRPFVTAIEFFPKKMDFRLPIRYLKTVEDLEKSLQKYLTEVLRKTPARVELQESEEVVRQKVLYYITDNSENAKADLSFNNFSVNINLSYKKFTMHLDCLELNELLSKKALVRINAAARKPPK